MFVRERDCSCMFAKISAAVITFKLKFHLPCIHVVFQCWICKNECIMHWSWPLADNVCEPGTQGKKYFVLFSSMKIVNVYYIYIAYCKPRHYGGIIIILTFNLSMSTCKIIMFTCDLFMSLCCHDIIHLACRGRSIPSYVIHVRCVYFYIFFISDMVL